MRTSRFRVGMRVDVGLALCLLPRRRDALAAKLPARVDTLPRVPTLEASRIMSKCAGIATPREGAYVVWAVSDAIALGNSLSVYLNTYLFAL